MCPSDAEYPDFFKIGLTFDPSPCILGLWSKNRVTIFFGTPCISHFQVDPTSNCLKKNVLPIITAPDGIGLIVDKIEKFQCLELSPAKDLSHQISHGTCHVMCQQMCLKVREA